MIDRHYGHLARDGREAGEALQQQAALVGEASALSALGAPTAGAVAAAERQVWRGGCGVGRCHTDRPPPNAETASTYSFGDLLAIARTSARGEQDDITIAISVRHEIEVWWLQLVGGLIELVLGFWAAGYYGRSAVLLIARVASFVIIRGTRDIVLAFHIRQLQLGLPG